MYDLVDIMGHPWVDNIDGFTFLCGSINLSVWGFFSLDLNCFFTGGSHDFTGTGGDQDDASLDQGLGQFSDGHASLATW